MLLGNSLRSRPIQRLRRIFNGLNGTDAIDDRVRRLMVDTLYSQPRSLVIGAICGISTSGIGAYLSNDPWLIYGCVALTIIAIARVTNALWLARSRNEQNARRLEQLYELGAFSYALTVGVLAAIAIARHVEVEIQILLVANAIIYGVGISARNAGRPFIAIGQLFLSLIPLISLATFNSVIDLNLAYLALAVALLLVLPAMMEITANVNDALRKSVAEAETSARLAERMQVLARTDIVTGLANRAGLNYELAEKFMALPDDHRLALLWIDLDRFKEVNDTLGHPVGDKLLAEVARRLRSAVPHDATVARFGGDEFIVACDLNTRLECEEVAGRILDEITRPFRIDGDRLEIGASMGIAVLPEDGADVDTLMQSADLALYHAKVSGRRQASFFAPSMTRDLVRRREIEAELRGAIQRNELSVFFQPIVDLETGRIRTFEALVRWFHPEKGELRPDEFIPVAEETGLIITLGNWITGQAARACAQWPEDVTVAVNLSPLQIKAPGAALGILNALKDARLDPRRLELEVTESLFLDDDSHTTQFMEELSSIGIRFALDDFGTGFSSLGYINKLPFKKIKVDRSFVSGANVGRKSDAILRAVAGMGSTLELDIVAEGLETIEQVRAVRNAGCTLGQGYYFSRAVPDYLASMLLVKEREKDAA